MLRFPNPEQVHYFLCAGPHLTKDHECDIYGFEGKKDKTCSHTIVRYCNCDEKHFASASTCPGGQRAIEIAKMGRAEWREGERAAQEAGIAIEAKEDVEPIIDETATMAEGIESPARADPTTMELTADKEEDTDKHIEGTIPEHWTDADIDSA